MILTAVGLLTSGRPSSLRLEDSMAVTLTAMPRRLLTAHWRYLRVLPLEMKKSQILTFCTKSSAVMPRTLRFDACAGLALQSPGTGVSTGAIWLSTKEVLWMTHDMLNSVVSLRSPTMPACVADAIRLPYKVAASRDEFPACLWSASTLTGVSVEIWLGVTSHACPRSIMYLQMARSISSFRIPKLVLSVKVMAGGDCMLESSLR